jgi:hypothetical protein
VKVLPQRHWYLGMEFKFLDSWSKVFWDHPRCIQPSHLVVVSGVLCWGLKAWAHQQQVFQEINDGGSEHSATHGLGPYQEAAPGREE